MTGDKNFQLHMITDGMKKADELKVLIEKALRGGADTIQLRYKAAPALDIYQLGKVIKPITDQYNANLLINDRIDVALALGATGVHLAGKSLPVHIARSILGQNVILGCSVHSVEEAKQAEDQGASYVTYGHIFPTKSKAGLPPRRIEGLLQVIDSVSIPVLAIGGITSENIGQVLATGVTGIAVIGAIANDQHPEAATRKLRQKMDDMGERNHGSNI